MIRFQPLGSSSTQPAVGARWTVLLSLIAFVGGGIVGLVLLFSAHLAHRAGAGAGRRASISSCSRARRC